MASLTSEITSATNFKLVTSPKTPLHVYDGRRNCRSILDAVTKLQTHQSSTPLRVILKTMKISRPDGKDTWMVMAFRYPISAENWAVRMPDATHFNALTRAGKPRRGPIAALHNAIFNSDGVTRHQGVVRRSVDLEKGPLAHYDLDATDYAVVSAAVKSLGEGPNCCRQIYWEALTDEEKALSDGVNGPLTAWHIDFAQIRKVKIKKLKKLVYDISKMLPHLRDSEIKGALRKAGFQFPQSGSPD